MDGKVFTYETVVRETQLDAFGHMNHARYLEVFEDARWDLINRAGYGLERIEATGLGPVILEVRVRYRRELRAGQKIRVRTRCVGYAGKIGHLEQRMLDGEGAEACTAEILIGLWDVKARRLVPPTREWLRAIGVGGEQLASRRPKRKPATPAGR
jgi:acyl-CoA thioester hydrolase